ncbi:MAG: SDR family oxidoreductase [Defluviitaleaceae bacterium]|nr:SDR family oxidoreductase [Defluviitaleaceae bacterium]
MKKLSGKNIVITGASSGIGECIALEVAKQGGTPILLARRLDQLEVLVKRIEETFHVRAYAFKLDVANEQEVVKVFATIDEQMGDIDVLINNAGYLLSQQEVQEMVYQEIKDLFAVNVLGLIACTQAVLSKMKAKNAGQIINVVSINGKLPAPKASAYVSTKHAALGFTNALRLELLKTNVQVTAINPGPVNTELFEKAGVADQYPNRDHMLDPKIVAQKIVATIGTKKRELNLPATLGFLGKCYALVPSLFEKLS